MAIDDNASYELTGYQVKDLAQKIRAKADSSSLANVATSGLYSDLTGAPTIPTVYNGTLTIQQNGTTAGTFTANSSSNTTISLTDTTYTHFAGATSSADGTQGLVPGPLTGDQNKVLYGDGTWKDATAKLVEMSYGEANAWSKFINAYNAGAIVYCRASSNSNPASGSQTRKAFMAYVNNATNPTNVEFQYVRSMSTKTDSQQCDQVFVYTLTNASGGTWSVASRNMSPKINVSAPITKTFTSGANPTIAIGANTMTGATSSAAGTAGIVPAPAAGDNTKFLAGDGTWKTIGGSSITYYIADGDPNYPQTLGNGFVYTDSARTVTAEAADIYADMQSGKTVYLEYRTGPASDRRETLFTINSMTRRDKQDVADRYDYYGSMTSYMDGSNTTLPATFGFLVSGTEPLAWQFVKQYIPTVNDATLTIQQNGTDVQTFTANSSTNKTANIDTHNGVLTANDLPPATDTVADWLTLFNSTPGYYVTFYSGTTKFTNQPYSWGQLETFISAQTNDPTKFEVYQKWHSQSDGEEYYRAGNSAGWFNSASDSGKFYKSESNNSARTWHAFGVTSATEAQQTVVLPGRVTCSIQPNAQGGVFVRNISSNNAIKKARVVATTYFTASQSNKTFGISGVSNGSRVYTRYSGLIASTAKAWTQYAGTASNVYADIFSDTFAMTSVSIEYVAALTRPDMNTWLLEGTISATGSASAVQFSAECTATDATQIPFIYVRGVSSSDISYFNASVELFI